MAVMVARAAALSNIHLNYEAVTFKDAREISQYALESVSYLCGSKIINGYEDSSFRPNNYTTRAEAVAILYRLKIGQ